MPHLIYTIAFIWLSLGLGRIAFYFKHRLHPEFWDGFKPDEVGWYKKTALFWDSITVLWLIPTGAIYNVIEFYQFIYQRL